MFDAQAFLANLTARPGVYCLLDAKQQLLYVGKAKNLKRRLTSYFRAQSDARLQSMVRQIAAVDITVTASDKEALLLENTLIKTRKPRYNVVLRDDKSYPYLLFSQSRYPRLVYHRGPQTLKGEYFGPYPSAIAVKEALNLLQRLFKLRQCDDSFFANRSRPCLQYQIKRCSAPCCDYISPSAYAHDVQNARAFLLGKKSAMIETLIGQMHSAAIKQDYETAARLRDQITQLRSIIEQQAVFKAQGNVDAIGLAGENGSYCIYVLFIREGKTLGGNSFFPNLVAHLSEAEIIRGFITQYYLKPSAQRDFPDTIIAGTAFEDRVMLAQMIAQSANKSVKILTKVKTHKASWHTMALDNAKIQLSQRLQTKSVITTRWQDLQKHLGLSSMGRIECFDISHTMGEATIGGCVVFEAQGALKNEYRRYNLPALNGDDYAAMRQTLYRRYSKFKAQDKSLPDIIVIDGGKGQLSCAKQALKECQALDVILLGIAKGPSRKPGLEQLFVAAIGDEESPEQQLMLPPYSPALHLLQHIRDEAHRFAIAGHRRKRGKSYQRSPLEQVGGIGPKKRQVLLNHFGGLQALSAASLDAIAKVPGISYSLAKQIYNHLHQK